MSSNVVPFARPQMVEEPHRLGLFLRPGYFHNQDLVEAIDAGHRGLNGVVFDASFADRQQDVREKVQRLGLDAVLDTQTQPLATEGGRTTSVLQLPWAGGSIHQPKDFGGTHGLKFVRQIADFAINGGYTGILAPTHFLENPRDPWLVVDRELTLALRAELDKRGHRRIDLYYSLAMPMAAFRSREMRTEILKSIQDLPVDEVWPRISRFGSDATGFGFSAYVDAMRDLKRLNLPIVAEYVGGLVGLALLAFGEISGIAHGVTVQERFNAYAWRKKRSGGGGNTKRIYIPELDMHLTKDHARTLFSVPGAKSKFLCHDTSICPNGSKDMFERPGYYFSRIRMKQVADLSETPPTLRAMEFMERKVRPMTDHAAFTVSRKMGDPELEKRCDKNRRRLDRLRPVLGTIAEHCDTALNAKALKVRRVPKAEPRPDRPSP